ncbi:hypothetical protein P3T76_009084 [Phytophthora citrophthora]|uniref:M96 mating-specific protein family n=1 Tax=Phytophthora citrophthora TaxID=4793 RepID=A0AAD9LKU7_9STRA|nr:hypothetical protein P3T76_009084 [Phytophthora citrophthora]
MEFALDPESSESIQATLDFIDTTMGGSSPPNSNDRVQSLDSSDWETSLLLDDFMTDFSSDASSPVNATNLTISPVSPIIETLSLTPVAQKLVSPSTFPTQIPTTRKRRNYNPNKAREELKHELTYLRSEAEELKLKLHQLQSFKVARKSDGASVRQIQDQGARRPFVWEQTCARQLECRLRSERENSHLKMLLEGQIQVARSLEKLLKKRSTLYSPESSGSRKTTRIHVSRKGNEVLDAAVFEELADGVEASYREVESVFASSGLELSNVSSRNARVRDATNGLSLEIFDSKVLPFSVHATGEAWWRRWNHFNPIRGSCHRLVSTKDTIVEHFGMEMSDSKAKTTARFYVQQILRQHIEEDRVVIVWESHVEPLEFSHKKLAGIRFREKGYVVIKPHEVSPDTNESYTLVETCHIIKPDLSDQRLEKDARTGALTEFVLSATIANIAAGAEMIEGLLMDEALQQRSRT